MSKESSYTAASVMPVKLLYNTIKNDDKLVPVHLQLYPTNACNLKCDFCSCRDVDKSIEISSDEMKYVLDTCKDLGTKAVTISGGGEPLLHKDINWLIDYTNKLDMNVGLTTNGILLDRLKYHNNITWCRVSSSDDRTPRYDTIKKAIELNPQVDWAFANVLTSKPDYKILDGLADLVNSDDRITHIKLHPNLFTISDVPLDDVKKHFVGQDDKIVYQDRELVGRGHKECNLPFIRPVVSPEGVFACCGAQFAIKGKERSMPDELKLGEIKDLEKILTEQKPIDGRICNPCYYNEYNDFLNKISDKPDHSEFL